MKLTLLLVLLVLSSIIRLQVSKDNPKIVIDDVDLQGAVHPPESVKRQLVADLMHREYTENSDWIADVEDKVCRSETEGWPDRENQGYLGFFVRAALTGQISGLRPTHYLEKSGLAELVRLV